MSWWKQENLVVVLYKQHMVCSVWLHMAALLLLHLLRRIKLSSYHLGNYEVYRFPSFFCHHFTRALIKCINKHISINLLNSGRIIVLLSPAVKVWLLLCVCVCVCVCVCLSVCHQKQNVILETPIVVVLYACLAVDRFWQHDSVVVVQDAVTKLHRCVLIKWNWGTSWELGVVGGRKWRLWLILFKSWIGSLSICNPFSCCGPDKSFLSVIS